MFEQSSLQWDKKYLQLEDPEHLINYLNKEGYSWLTDFNSGIKGEPYIPYRILFPSGKILDEKEIFLGILELKKLGFSKEEIQKARILYYSVNHEKIDKDKYKFNNASFISKKDEIETKKKYSEHYYS